MKAPYKVNGNERDVIYVRNLVRDIAGKKRRDVLMAELDKNGSIHLFGIVHIVKNS